MLASAIMRGEISHRRYQPTQHAFRYATAQWWLALDELTEVDALSRCFSTRGWAPLWFRRRDYLPQRNGDLAQAVRDEIGQLLNTTVQGRVFFLGNVRTFGCYFSPINCYFVQTEGDDDYRYMLAEVSNTPWLERHYYALDLQQPLQHRKQFHVSPFNPLEMQYHWRIRAPQLKPAAKALIHLEAWREGKHFAATVALQRQPLQAKSIYGVLLRFPVNTVTTVLAIYWQALRLWLKRTPIYDHPAKQSNHLHKNV